MWSQRMNYEKTQSRFKYDLREEIYSAIKSIIEVEPL